MPTFQVISFGNKLVETKFRRAGADALNAKPALSKVADYLMHAIDQRFASQGRRGGGSWKRLSPKWAKRKARLGGDPRILHFRGAVLRKSMTKRKARGQILVFTPTSVTLETKIKYAKTQHFGRGGIPARPFIKLTPHDRINMAKIIQDHLMRQWKRGGTGVRR